MSPRIAEPAAADGGGDGVAVAVVVAAAAATAGGAGTSPPSWDFRWRNAFCREFFRHVWLAHFMAEEGRGPRKTKKVLFLPEGKPHL